MLSLVRSLGPLPGCFFFWVLGLSHPWLYDADNRVAIQIRKRLLCLFPVWNNERQWRGNRQSCTRPSALVFSKKFKEADVICTTYSSAIFFFLGPRVVPSLAVWCWQSSGNPNKEKAIVPVSSVKQRKAMKREQAIVHEALSSCFFFKCSESQNWSRTGPNCKEGSHKPKLDMQNSQSLLIFFLL